MKITFLDAVTLGEDLSERIKTIFSFADELEMFNSTSPDEVAERIGTCDIVVINKVKLNSENLHNAKNLKLICIAATGYDNVDVEYCKKSKIGVANVVGYSTQSVAQITLAMVMELACHMTEYQNYVKSGEYTKSGVANRLVPVYHELCGKTWGIVGGGNIGMQVARVAEAIGCNVIINKRKPIPDVKCVDLDTLCRESDIISVHVPLNESTRNLISKDKISMMKHDAVFVNVARGAVTDEETLVEALENHRLGGIGIDVYSKEPFEKDHPYNRILNYPNACFTPHNAWGAYEARVRCMEIIAENIKSFSEGGRKNRVDI